jgi:hypothetical protein
MSRQSVVQLMKPGVVYFALVFMAGFVLGPIRELWAVPRFGVRMAELMEMPIMFVVIVLAARWTVRKLAVPGTPSRRLCTGLVALGLLLVAEFTVVLGLRGLTVEQYVAERDPVAGTAYAVMLGVFAIMPLLVFVPMKPVKSKLVGDRKEEVVEKTNDRVDPGVQYQVDENLMRPLEQVTNPIVDELEARDEDERE